MKNTQDTSIAPFDFRSPGRQSLENGEQWQHWLDHFSTDFREKWLQLANVELDVSIADQTVLSFDVVRQRMPRPAIARNFSIGPEKLQTLLVFDRSLALGLVLQLLGETLDELPEDRPLSAIEFSLCNMLFQRMVESLSESWPQKETLECQMQETDLFPHRSRLWEPREVLFVCYLGFSIGDATHRCMWVIPQDEIEKLLESLDAPNVEKTAASVHEMEQRVFDVKVPLTVELGRTTVAVSRLAELAVGDVLVFEQRINEPLPLLVNDKTKFYGWLGRTGNRQAFKVSEVR